MVRTMGTGLTQQPAAGRGDRPASVLAWVVPTLMSGRGQGSTAMSTGYSWHQGPSRSLLDDAALADCSHAPAGALEAPCTRLPRCTHQPHHNGRTRVVCCASLRPLCAGYSVLQRNVTRVCERYLPASCSEQCLQQTVDSILAAQAAAADSGTQQSLVGIVVPAVLIPVGGLC